jgi:hypothetical protein
VTHIVTVTHIVAGTLAEETLTADRITYQHLPPAPNGDRAVFVRLWDGGRVAEEIAYSRVEYIRRRGERPDHSDYDVTLTPREDTQTDAQ